MHIPTYTPQFYANLSANHENYPQLCNIKIKQKIVSVNEYSPANKMEVAKWEQKIKMRPPSRFTTYISISSAHCALNMYIGKYKCRRDVA